MQQKTRDLWEAIRRNPPPLPPKNFFSDGERELIKWQREHDMTHKEISEYLGVSDKSYAKWVTGVQVPSESMRRRIEARCGIKADSWEDV